MPNHEPAHLAVNGLDVAYRRRGEGAPLVLLHGFLCDSRCWRTQLEGLSDAFDVIAWDAPGAGESADPPDPFTFADWSASLAGFLDALGIERAHLVGLSWGGILAQEFCRLHAARVSGLVLAGTYAGWKGSLPADVCAQRLVRCMADSYLPPGEFTPRWVPEMFSAAASPELLDELSAIIAGFHPAGFRLMARSSAETDTTASLGAIGVPTLLLWGDQDRRSPLGVAVHLRDLIPGARLETIPAAGHVCNMERPEAFSAHVGRFCS